MKKYIIFSLLFVNLGFGQNPEIKTELPELIGPSPTVSALMKYEEIPVSNYTGVPNISVPFFNYKFPSNSINLNVGLSYHSQSTRLDEVASDVGLGWSLTGGGSISRVVRDMPDELISNHQKYGVYRTSTTNNNNYYQVIDLMQNNNGINYQSPINIVNNSSPELVKEFLWETNAKAKYDTQHDLWQYNFLGYSGRFYIEKQSNGVLEVKLLEDSALKIINHYNLTNQSVPVQDHYKPIGFTVYDDLGYKFVFDVVEETQSNQFSETTAHNGMMNMTLNSETFNSAFHLSKIYDNNGVLMVQYDYLNAGEEHVTNSSNTQSYPTSSYNLSYEINQAIDVMNGLLDSQFISGLYKPMITNSSSSNIYLAKKLKEINITGVGKVMFDYETGRLDDDYTNRQNVLILKNIITKDFNSNIVKNFELQHIYIDALKKKLFLEKVIDVNSNNSLEQYVFSYKQIQSVLTNPTPDYWGYLTNIPSINTGFYREVNPSLVDMFSLAKMKLPTGGSVVFNYESNTYSAEKNILLTNFDENPHNWNEQYEFKTFNSVTNNLVSFFTLNDTQNVYFTKEINFPTNDWAFKIYKEVKSPSTYVGAVSNYSTENNFGFVVLNNLEPGNYLVEFVINDIPPSGTTYNAKIYATYKNKEISNYKNYLYGGGFRISSIATYESDVNLSLIQSEPLSEIKYNYNFFDNSAISSGSLTSRRPIYSYSTYQFKPELRAGLQGGANTLLEYNHTYDIHSSIDKINKNKTKGADIGYKNVSVSKIKRTTGFTTIENGRTDYTYTSSLEYPDEERTIPELFLPSINCDYKRGLLAKEENYNADNKKLNTTEYMYSFDNYSKLTGLHIFGTYDQGYNSCPAFKLMSSYDNYKQIKLANCQPSSNPCTIDFFQNTFRDDLNLGYQFLVENYGWAKLINKTTKNYFYPNGSSMPNIVESVETYAYNPINKKISESTVSNSRGETLTTKYFYHTGNSVHSQNRISEIERVETYRGSDLLSKSQIVYNNNWTNNVSFLPQTIQTAKGSEGYENRLHYLNYDEFGNPLEVKQEEGIHICYIWGYNKTQPIAKIENATYNDIQPFEANLQALSNGTDEQGLITALNNLRTALPNAMITTYTYKPLVGISTVTDPKGNKQTYHYDSFNRLEFVKDAQGNILSENQYHYRTQN